MSPLIRAEITKRLGTEPIMINSALVSAQHRQRLYWTNIPGIILPQDKGLTVRDILDTPAASPLNLVGGEKAYALKAQYYKTSAANLCGGGVHYPQTGAAEPVRIGTIENSAINQNFDSQQYRVYSPDGKSVTLCGNGGGVGAKTGLYAAPALAPTPNTYVVKDGQIFIRDQSFPIDLADGLYIVRKLTVSECKRLQTVPESYIFPVSNTQAYKMLGNGWTVDVIAHILSFCPDITTQPLDVLSMYDGMSCGHIALDKLGCETAHYWATEIDKYAIKTTMANYPSTIQLGDAFQVRDPEWML